jgi:predicted alpha/beta superfamily hydrolase
MNRRHFCTSLCAAAVGGCAAVPTEPLPAVTAGRVERLASFTSRHVAPRHVDVWLPPGYDARQRRRVLYMHDGQAVFDGAASISGAGWRVDAALQALSAQGAFEAPIVVAPWNDRTWRHSEYFPQPMLDRVPAAVRERLLAAMPQPLPPAFDELLRHGRTRSQPYLRFLTEELKPAIDARYATRPERDATFIMGSSMGGLISVHALLEHPQVFAGAASLSTHWIGVFERNDAISDAALAWLRDRLPAAPPWRLYLDRGTIELDAHYAHAQAQVDALLRERGLAAPRVVSRVFEGTGHNERDWARRVHLPLSFLLGAAT